MIPRSSASADETGDFSFEPHEPHEPHELHEPHKSQISNAEPERICTRLKSRTPSLHGDQTGLSWFNANGHNERFLHHTTALPPLFASSFAVTASDDNVAAKVASPVSSQNRQRGPWFISTLGLSIACLGMALLFAILNSLVSRQNEPKGCRMSYMRPSYTHFADFDTEHTRFASKYSLYLYREQGIDDDNWLQGIPVLFIPGNAGSYKQVRPIAAEAANYFHDEFQSRDALLDSTFRSLDFFTVDFNEDITAFHGQTLLDQAEYLNEAIRYILSLYSDPMRFARESHLPDPTSVLILGHSMGGVVARAMLVQPNFQSNSINTIITLSAPHARPPVTFDGRIVQIYDEINTYWRQAYSQKWASNNPLWHVTLVSIAGGSLDTVVPSDYASIQSLVPETHGFTVFTTGIPKVWTSMDHQAILWCDQFRKVVARTLYEIVDVHRATQTKPRAERMRILKKNFLTGLEADAEKTYALREATTMLTINDDSSHMVPVGSRLILQGLDTPSQSKAYLLPIPPLGSPETKRFTLMTDSDFEEAGGGGNLQVLACSIFPSQPGSSSPHFSSNIDFAGNNTTPTRMACRNVASDFIVLPSSTQESHYPFPLEWDEPRHPFLYLQYDLEHLLDHQFIAVIQTAGSTNYKFLIAEFSNQFEFQKKFDLSLAELLTFGLSLTLPAHRPLAIEVSVPPLKSGLLAYSMEVVSQQCHRHHLFAPLIRQYLDKPYESRYFVNAKSVDISLHGVAPFMPPALESRSSNGVGFGIWADPTCPSELRITLTVDVLGSLGKLYMRYRTVFAAFPLLIVTLVLRKQFRVYDTTGGFISFSESLDLSLRQSIPLLLLSLTLLSMSLGGITSFLGSLIGSGPHSTMPLTIDFHKNDLLIGTEDPLFVCLVSLIGVVCIGVCAVLHFIMLGLTQTLGTMYGILAMRLFAGAGNRHQAHFPAFTPSTPRRRMISTAVLLFLVSTFIPFQFAYLVACLVQLFTVVRALHIQADAQSALHLNYYNYSHSILLLMMWVLPINLPILAVWIRNLAVHWLTPFSSHHNVLSIMPFILLVENLTTGRMVPQMTSGLRHVTSGLLFGTALCAAIYGVSHAYVLHYLVNIIAAWLVVLHSTSDSWSIASIVAMFEGNAGDGRKRGKSP